MLRVAGAILGALVVASSCAGLDRPALTSYDDVRAAIVVSTDPETGTVKATSENAALIEVSVYATDAPHSKDDSGIPGGAGRTMRGIKTVFTQAERQADGSVTVSFVHRRSYPTDETQFFAKPWPETDPDRKAFVGSPWREVRPELVEFRYECRGARIECTRHAEDRFVLSDEDVRVLLSQRSDKIRISFSLWRQVDWTANRDELVAVLDAVGASDMFR